MSSRQMKKGVIRFVQAFRCGMLGLLLGGFLFGYFISTVSATENINSISRKSSQWNEFLHRISSSSAVGKRRDPFQPVRKPRAISSSPKKAVPDPGITKITKGSNPHWKLLGIIDGQDGPQAVIQLSAHERVFVKPGLEVVHSGWITKAIKQSEVVLEQTSPSIPGKDPSKPKALILSFANPRTSS